VWCKAYHHQGAADLQAIIDAGKCAAGAAFTSLSSDPVSSFTTEGASRQS
jgi:hypothetical protein